MIQYFVVDTFTNRLFQGNPTGVCVLEKTLDSVIMQKIAAENNLSETAFIRKVEDGYDLKWFTPETEVDLCAHATLGAAFVVANFLEDTTNIKFFTKSGVLEVERQGDFYEINLLSMPMKKVEISKNMIEALGIEPKEAYLSRDLVFILDSESEVMSLTPNFEKLHSFEEGLGVVVTAKGEDFDFVSRCFFPKLGVKEDMATGSSHCILAPFWSFRLEKEKLIAKQLSQRQGVLYCEIQEDTVKISGTAVLYLKGNLQLI